MRSFLALLTFVIFMQTTGVFAEGRLTAAKLRQQRNVNRYYFYRSPSVNYGWRGAGWSGWGYGAWGWNNRYHASTAAQGWLDGVSNIMWAQGQRAESYARAYRQIQESRRRHILNDSLYVKHWFERRKMNRVYRAAERPAPPTPEQVSRLSKMNLPTGMDDKFLNRTNGNIHWPDIFKWSVFSDCRAAMDRLYQIRYDDREISQTGMGSANFRYTKIVGDKFLELLKTEMQSGTMSGEEYVFAKNFIRSLVYESRKSVR